jgi:acyl-CoA reductase-like NAD-dependent aldehyde dehydrogenase
MIAHPFPFCGGRYLVNLHSNKLDVFHKYDGSLLTSIPQTTNAEHDLFISSALSGFAALKNFDASQKAKIFNHVASHLNSKIDFYTHLIAAEAGKPISLAKVEVERSIQTLHVGAREVMNYSGEVVPMDFGRGRAKHAFTAKFPVGPVLAFSPFNFPLNLALHKIVPALAVGCSIVLKAPPQAPLSILSLAAAFQEAGLPDGALNITVCDNQTAFNMLADERYQVFSFTGSDRVGWMLKKDAGKKRCILELGGNAAVIVDETADLHDAARQIATSAFMYAGQVCISTQRVYVVETIAEMFRDLLISETAKIKSGDPSDELTLNGPLISKEVLLQMESLVAEAVRGGATVIAGGQTIDFHRNIFAPTILTGTTPEMAVNADETFGPIITFEVCRNADHAFELANNTRFGLQCGYFTQRLDRMKTALQQIRVGSLIINSAPGFRLDHMPYGGLRDSGEGLEGIRYAMDALTETRLLVF